MFLSFPFGFFSTRLSTSSLNCGGQVSIIKLTKFILELLFKAALSVVGCNPLSGISLRLLHSISLKTRRAHILERILVDELLQLFFVHLLGLVQEVIHIEIQREGDSLIKLLTLPGLHIKCESLQLEGEYLGQPV